MASAGPGYYFHSNPELSYLRKAFTQNLLQEKVKDRKETLKKHGAKDKLDNRTCLFCLAPPNTYHDVSSLSNNAVFMELTRHFGVSSMHLKIW